MSISLGVVEDKPELIRSVMEKVCLFDNVEVVWVAENGLQAIEEVRSLLRIRVQAMLRAD